MIPGLSNRRRFSDLSEQEILALAISSEEDDARIYRSYAERLRGEYSASAAICRRSCSKRRWMNRRSPTPGVEGPFRNVFGAAPQLPQKMTIAFPSAPKRFLSLSTSRSRDAFVPKYTEYLLDRKKEPS